MENMEKKLEVKKMKDWYSISQKEIQKDGESGLLSKYSDFSSKLMRSVFSEHL